MVMLTGTANLFGLCKILQYQGTLYTFSVFRRTAYVLADFIQGAICTPISSRRRAFPLLYLVDGLARAKTEQEDAYLIPLLERLDLKKDNIQGWKAKQL